MGVPAALLSAALTIAAVLLAMQSPGRRRRVLTARGAAGAREPGHRPKDRPVEALHLVASAGAAVAVLLVVPGAQGLGVAAVVGAIVWWRSRQWESGSVRRRRARLEAELPHVVDLMTAALGAGAAPTTALSLIAEVVDEAMAEELHPWMTRLALGTDPVTVWGSMAGHPQLGRLGATLHRSAESGAPVAAALLRLSEDLRARRRSVVEERVRQVEVRAAVPLGVCLLPSFVLVGVVPLVAGSVTGLVVIR
jgi:Flp pilus assembly protein TadB